MKLTRYITKYDYELFINHNITINELIENAHIDEGDFNSTVTTFRDGWKKSKITKFIIPHHVLSIEIKENK